MVVAFTYGTTAGVTATDSVQLGHKTIRIKVPATFVWGTDSIVVDLTKFGCSKIVGFRAYEETTLGSVVIAATGTTSVSSGVLTFVSTGSGANTVVGSLFIDAE
jgi:hypothetical protein